MYTTLQTCNTTISAEVTADREKHQKPDRAIITSLTIPLAIIQDPYRLFMAIKFNFASKNDIPIENVKFRGIFGEKPNTAADELSDNMCKEDLAPPPKILQAISEEAREYVITLLDLILQGVNWDYER